MALRIFYAVLALVALYLSFGIFQMASAWHALDRVEDGYFVASADADLTVVEFLDYSCPDCQEIHPVIAEALRRDGRIRYIPLPVSILGPEGGYAASVVYAAGKQGKFLDMHEKLISNYRVLLDHDDLLQEMAQELNLDFDRLKQDLGSKGYFEPVRKNTEILNVLSRPSTPTYFIGDKTIYIPTDSMPTVDDFLRMFNEVRNRK